MIKSKTIEKQVREQHISSCFADKNRNPEMATRQNPSKIVYIPFQGKILKESQREASPLLYNQFPFPLVRGRG